MAILSSLRFVALALLSSSYVHAANSPTTTGTNTWRAIPTLDSSISNTAPLIPNIYDPQAVNAQEVCPGYTASNVQYNQYGFTASLTLAGKPCNVYGTDIDALSLTVQYQSDQRLLVNIVPAYLVRTIRLLLLKTQPR